MLFRFHVSVRASVSVHGVMSRLDNRISLLSLPFAIIKSGTGYFFAQQMQAVLYAATCNAWGLSGKHEEPHLT